MSPAMFVSAYRATIATLARNLLTYELLRASMSRMSCASSPGSQARRNSSIAGVTIVALALVVPTAAPAVAQETPPDTGTETIFGADGWPLPPDPAEPLSLLPSSRPRWDCRLFEELVTYTKDIGELTVNNLRLRGKTGRFSNTPTAELSFTVINRSSERSFTTFQFTVYDRTSPLPSISFSLEPSFGIIAPDSTKQLTAHVNVRPGEVERAARFCIRADG